MSGVYLSTENQPFCRGCGHSLMGRAIEKALCNSKSLKPLDVVVVTDIGCVGIIDKQFKTHTVHGLHGRSVGLATGISMGLQDPKKKIIVMIGDGGATIGLHHIIEAAHLNINMTVLVHNNMLYGMTGGQTSGLTPQGFKTPTMPEGRPDHGMDICRLVHSAGAAYARRILALGDFSDVLEEAFAVDGFSLVEAVELCPSHGVKYNPGRKLDELTESVGLSPVLLRNTDKPSHRVHSLKENSNSLLDSVPGIHASFNHNLRGTTALLLAGSAGEGVQSAAELLAKAAISCGLSVTKKGSYPVTVGVGFSLAELVFSTEEIDYTGVSNIDAALVASADGLAKSLPRIEGMTGGILFIDSSLQNPSTAAETVRNDYRKHLGPRSAALLLAAQFVRKTGFIEMEAFFKTLAESKIGRTITREKLQGALEELTD